MRVVLIVLLLACPLAAQERLVCETPAKDEAAQQFDLFDPQGLKPRSSLEDAPLMDPPEDTPDARSFTFSNECDNAFTITLDRATLDEPGSIVTGRLFYFMAESHVEHDDLPLTCRRLGP